MPETRSAKTPKASPIAKNVPDAKKDIVISIKTPHMNNIVARLKNHEFRKYLISRTVERMWLYVSSQTLRYIAIISQAKVPGEIADDVLEGIGNVNFNEGHRTSHAYEIKHLYKLRLPLHITVLGQRYGISPPQRYAYAPTQLLEDVKLEEQEMLF
ncbi:hypothetical protein DFH06DRAFT_1390481 [Mycena polygramma]|nr:hypothetical protein DFH06DRAFT_1390481 [Mycena polygramma]